MKMKFITLQQHYSKDHYIVDQLGNTVMPRAGSVLNEREVRSLIQERDTKVTIKRAKS